MQKILLLEDEKQIGLDLQYLLNREGYQVEHFTTGEAAVEAALENEYDLMILDIMLKRTTNTTITNGLEVARKIQQVKEVPFILLTARTDSYDIMTGLDSGAEDYIPKPYDLTELLARLRAVFRRITRTQKQASMVQVGKIKLNLLSHKVYVNDKEVKLPNQQFDLLHYLMIHKNEVLTKEELYKNVWGYELMNGTTTNTLEVNIKRLRKVIGSELITTHRGIGYAFEG